MKRIVGKVDSLHLGVSEETLGKEVCKALDAHLSGFAEDRHSSYERQAWAGDDKQAEGTRRRNERQWSAVSLEELAEISVKIKDIMENIKAVKGVAYSRDEAKLTLVSVADRPGVAASIFVPLADAGVNVDMIVQNISEEGRTDMTFSCPVDQVIRAEKALTEAMNADLINYKELIADTLVAKISIVGNGMRSHAGVAAQMFEVLANEGVNIRVITTSEIKVSVLVDRKYMELAVRALHDAFELENA